MLLLVDFKEVGYEGVGWWLRKGSIGRPFKHGNVLRVP